MSRTIADWKERLSSSEIITESELTELRADSRIGIQKLLQSYLKLQERAQAEQMRIEGMWRFERRLWAQGKSWIAGVDEAGRGPLAGPVVAAAVILPPDFDATGLNDSKQVKKDERNRLRQEIEQEAIAVGVGIIDVPYIDQYNILQATYKAMRVALSQLQPIPDFILGDAVKIPRVTIPQHGIIKGDAQSHSIAAASIIAKTTRDEYMIRLADKYPGYGFEKHMGYGTPEHLQAIEALGITPEHRSSFAPIQAVLRSR
ncbi:ribonuclease HII [Thermoactinomyces sp. DSM 45892]|uniref:ribonuclease HII n=1 Tax=Thermoactinomyces sp. DSM 45892 TaxID=1882753 RepID=UPI0008951299|nr:ribonuclease HII [Thermoactinomyces sp. DSM 45892]SDX97844.1 RNase HII [Thermoactinomyces sp. DSM 45892]